MSKTLNSFNLLLVAMTLLGLFAPFSTAAPFAASAPSGTNVTSSKCRFIIEVIGACLSGGKDCCVIPKLKSFKPIKGKKVCDDTVITLERKDARKDGLNELKIVCESGHWKVIAEGEFSGFWGCLDGMTGLGHC